MNGECLQACCYGTPELLLPCRYHSGCSPSRTRYYPRTLYSSCSNSPKPAGLAVIRFAHFSSTGSVRVGFESHILFSLFLFSRYTTYEIRYTSLWRTQLQPIRTFGEISPHIKILPVQQPYLYQKLSGKATQLRLLGMTYGQIAKNLDINRKTAVRACKYEAKNKCFGRQNLLTD